MPPVSVVLSLLLLSSDVADDPALPELVGPEGSGDPEAPCDPEEGSAPPGVDASPGDDEEDDEVLPGSAVAVGALNTPNIAAPNKAIPNAACHHTTPGNPTCRTTPAAEPRRPANTRPAAIQHTTANTTEYSAGLITSDNLHQSPTRTRDPT
ncbi:hypothetical protein TTY48_03780 [Tsukamurella sp. TY48]|nr:hypothetical protein TTY48_03780 [Tsukamurella sp. TY48]